MRKVKIRLPATITNLGPGLNSLGMALAMYASVDIAERGDATLIVEPSGEGAGLYSVGLRHPVVLGMIRVFQQVENAPLGLSVRVENQIPFASGLGAESALTIAGIIGANNLMGNPLSRDALLTLAAEVTGQPDRAVAAIRGGLTSSTLRDGVLAYRSLPLARLNVVVALPDLDSYAENTENVVPDRVLLADALRNISQIPVLLDALRDGNHTLLAQIMEDRLSAPFYHPFIPGYDEVVEQARQAGASGITLSGQGPALVFFAPRDERHIAETVRDAFRAKGVAARVWMLPVDTQGVVVSVAGT